MKKSDVMDRWTILRMKARVDPAAKSELAVYEHEVSSCLSMMKDWDTIIAVVLELVALAESNARIWELESAIRREYPTDPSMTPTELALSEIGRRTIAIREHNARRVQAKKSMDLLFGEVPDNKVDHASGK